MIDKTRNTKQTFSSVPNFIVPPPATIIPPFYSLCKRWTVSSKGQVLFSSVRRSVGQTTQVLWSHHGSSSLPFSQPSCNKIAPSILVFSLVFPPLGDGGLSYQTPARNARHFGAKFTTVLQRESALIQRREQEAVALPVRERDFGHEHVPRDLPNLFWLTLAHLIKKCRSIIFQGLADLLTDGHTILSHDFSSRFIRMFSCRSPADCDKIVDNFHRESLKTVFRSRRRVGAVCRVCWPIAGSLLSGLMGKEYHWIPISSISICGIYALICANAPSHNGKKGQMTHMKTQILEKLNDLKIKSGKSFEDVHDALGFAASTVHRWHKGESNPDMDQLTALVEYYGGDMKDLYADVGKQEMTATQDIGYQGADVMVEHYEARLAAAKEKYEILQAHHNQRVEEINENHKRVTDYLKTEINRLRSERDSARATSLDVVSKKHRVFGVLSVICVIMGLAISLLIVLLIIAFKTDAIL